MTRDGRTMDRARMVLLVTLVLLGALSVVGAQELAFKKSHIRMQRLCSRNLSDALYIVCQDRGYNGPFSSNDEDETMANTGPGLVEECCYHGCTYEQMERYCRPLSAEKQVDSTDDAIEESYVANLPYPPIRDLSSEQSPPLEMDYAGGAIKRKVDDLKRGRHRGKRGRNVDGVCKGKVDARKLHRGRHCRCRRRRLECRRAGKVLRGNIKPLDNKFVTTSTTDRPVSFPSVS